MRLPSKAVMILAAVLGVAVAFCLDVGVSTTQAADTCTCDTVAVEGVIGPQGHVVLMVRAPGDVAPVLAVYRKIDGRWVAHTDFDVRRGMTGQDVGWVVTVYGDEFSDVVVVGK